MVTTRSGALVSAAGHGHLTRGRVLVMRSGGDDVTQVLTRPASPAATIAVPLKRADVPTQAPLRTPAAAPTQAPTLPSARVDVSVEAVRTGALEGAQPPPTPLRTFHRAS